MQRAKDWPGDKSAPDGLQLVVNFLNTVDHEAGTDALASPATLATWLEQQGVFSPATELSESDRRRALAARAGLWAVAADHSTAYRNQGGDRDAIAQLDTLAATAVTTMRFDADGTGRLAATAKDFDQVLGHLFALVVFAQRAGHWSRVKVCANSACRRAFWDASNNRGGKWCAVRRCGNKLKARTARSAMRRWR